MLGAPHASGPHTFSLIAESANGERIATPYTGRNTGQPRTMVSLAPNVRASNIILKQPVLQACFASTCYLFGGTDVVLKQHTCPLPVFNFDLRAQALTETPGILNEDPMGKGWFMKIKITDDVPDTLLDPAAYKTLCEEST